MTLKARIEQDRNAALKAQEKERLGALRLLLSAIKQIEVDQRIQLDDTQILAVIEKLIKQRRESIEQFKQANRQDLMNKEQAEIDVMQIYLPEQLSEAEVDQLIQSAITATAASTMKDMGNVMAQLKPQLQGRADMSKVSSKIKSLLNAS